MTNQLIEIPLRKNLRQILGGNSSIMNLLGGTPETRLWRGVSHGILTECSEQVQDLVVSIPRLSSRRVTQPQFRSCTEVVSDDNFISFGWVKATPSRCILIAKG
jgi:hypothetical protein